MNYSKLYHIFHYASSQDFPFCADESLESSATKLCATDPDIKLPCPEI